MKKTLAILAAALAFGRQRVHFAKYKVAPRLGDRALEERLERRLIRFERASFGTR